jgi:hypothetical protein
MQTLKNGLWPILAMVGVACADSGAQPWLLEGPRVLAIRAEPVALPKGEPVVLEALAHAVTQFTWRGCVLPWVPEVDPICPSGAVALGSGNPVTIDPPAGATVLHVRLDARSPDGSAEPAILRLQAGAKGSNLSVTLQQEGGEALPDRVTKTATLKLRSSVPGGAPAGAFNTFYATGGDFAPWRTLGSDASSWQAPDLAGPVTVTVIVRDGQGGVGWQRATLTVQP